MTHARGMRAGDCELVGGRVRDRGRLQVCEGERHAQAAKVSSRSITGRSRTAAAAPAAAAAAAPAPAPAAARRPQQVAYEDIARERHAHMRLPIEVGVHANSRGQGNLRDDAPQPRAELGGLGEEVRPGHLGELLRRLLVGLRLRCDG